MPRDVIEIRGLNELVSRLDDVSQNVFERRLMAEIGEYIIFRIEKHTAQGKDVEGRNFEPYSPRYKLFRRKTGHPVDKVNLFYSGSMMSSMTRTETDNESKVFFMPTTDRSGASNPLKAYALNKKRRFFAIGVVEQQKIIDMVREHAEQLLLGEG
jgi:hypothetical protein